MLSTLRASANIWKQRPFGRRDKHGVITTPQIGDGIEGDQPHTATGMRGSRQLLARREFRCPEYSKNLQRTHRTWFVYYLILIPYGWGAWSQMNGWAQSSTWQWSVLCSWSREVMSGCIQQVLAKHLWWSSGVFDELQAHTPLGAHVPMHVRAWKGNRGKCTWVSAKWPVFSRSILELQ